MYICGDTNVDLTESEYVPNLFGCLPLEQECPSSSACGGCNSCQDTTTPHGSDFVDCGNCLDHNSVLSLSQSNSHTTLSNSYWNDEMSTFPGLPSLDIEPLPSLFPFSPCAGYKQERPTHDMADVLLSLKNAVLKPSPEPHPCHTSQPPQNYGSNSYHQHIHHHHHQNQNAYTSSAGYYEPLQPSSCTGHNFPSMHVNVSMNMQWNPSDGMQCSQMQWNPSVNASSVNVLYPPLLSPGPYPSNATYSFTADFRPNNQTGNLTNSQSQPNTTNSIALNNIRNTNSSAQNIGSILEPISKAPLSPITTTQKSFYQSNICYTTPKTSPILESKPKSIPSTKSNALNVGYENDDSNSGDCSNDIKTNLCRLCGKTYARPSTLKTHLRTHSGERPYRCPDCNKSFSQAANLTAHVRTHTGQKPFRCPICDRRFSQSSSVTTHMRTHSGERPYRCRACKKAFSDSSTLTKHLRIHSGEKPYQCKLCLLRFSQSGNLNRHMRVHGSNGNMLT